LPLSAEIEAAKEFLQWVADHRYLWKSGFTPGYTPNFRRRTASDFDEAGPISGEAVAFLVSAVSSKAAAANMTNKAAAQQIIAAADQAIAAFIDSDDICPRWPYPGPPPWLSIIASELTLVANTLQEGSLRTGILQAAGRVLDRVALNPQPLPPGQAK
jgi:ABC-type glycerol-3-phosphate transport system substrate-binding protein